jgi:pescadillo protein
MQVKSDVDYKVMMTFLEFYQTLLGFVNFKLFHSLGLAYPPKWNDTNDTGLFLRSLIVENTTTTTTTSNNNNNLLTKMNQSRHPSKVIIDFFSDFKNFDCL